MKSIVRDVMRKDVVTVHTSTEFKEIVRLLEVARISALPVLDDAERLVGLISEADLLLKEEHHGEQPRRFQHGRRRAEHEKAAGTRAWEMMSAPVVTIGPDEPVGAAARAMHKYGVKRLPVLDAEAKLVGIVSRRDLLSVFMRPDEEIHHEIVHDVITRKLWLTPEEGHVQVSVENGMVKLEGQIDRKSMVEILVGLVHGVEGVVGVENGLSYEEDDTRVRPFTSTPWGVLPYSLRRP